MYCTKQIIVFILLLLIQPTWSQPPRLDSFNTRLHSVSNETLRNRLSENEIVAAKMIANKASGPETTWNPIMELWLSGEQDFLELRWWRETDRETRTFLAALIWCQNPPSKKGEARPGAVSYFDDYAHRFSASEKGERLEELEFVKQNLSVLAGRFSAIYRKLDSPRAKELAGRYQRVADQEGQTGKKE